MAKRPQQTKKVREDDRFTTIVLEPGRRPNPARRELLVNPQFRPKSVPSRSRYRRRPKHAGPGDHQE